MCMTPTIRKYFKSIGKKGGQSCSERKKIASRENGKKGGRPKKRK